MAISKEDMLNPRAFIVDRGEVVATPDGNIPPPLTPWEPAPEEWMQRQMLSDDSVRRKRQYDMEVESADRLRRAQAADQYWSRNIRPPDFLSEFRPPSAAQINAERPRFQPLGGALYDLTGGTPRLAVPRAERTPDPSEILDYEATANLPLGEGMQWVRGPSGWVQQRIPVDNSNAALFGRGAGSAASKRPTRSQAAEFVKKYGKANAVAELKKQGFDTGGYAD